MTEKTGAETLQKTQSRAAVREEAILAKWRIEKTFEKSVQNPAGRAKPIGEFTFYDGPPFATGTPHYGHILASIIKDAIPRYKTMRGYRVHRRWGWDCHGLPIENLVEKELGFKSKLDIEQYGLERFSEVAREFVLRYTDIWREQVPRFGRFVDMDNDYRTMDPSYTESVWWIFKTLHQKNLIYEGFKSMQMCPRCGTTLSNFEVNQGYKDITDISAYVTFKLKDEPGTSLVAWTTTPWTLPGNTALAVGANVDYVKVRIVKAVTTNTQGAALSEQPQTVIIAKDRLEATLKAFANNAPYRSEILSEMKGSALVGKYYTPVFPYYANLPTLKNRQNGWRVYAADFVTTTDGTGIVHIAPAFGADDYTLSLRENIPFVQHVAEDGTFKAEVKEFAGQKVKPKSEEGEKDGHQKGDVAVIKYLATAGILFAKEKITHSYPHCWRCDTPLLNFATSSWFVKVTDLKDKLVAENKRIAWVPHEVGANRFGDWLEGARDWAISRQRYWGAPLPVWKTVFPSGTAHVDPEIKVLTSIEDIHRNSKRRNQYFIMRHGQSESNTKGLVSSAVTQKNDHLTDEGRNQVLAAAQDFKKGRDGTINPDGAKIDLIIASPFTRTRETAEIVHAELGLPKGALIFDEQLIEVGAPGFDGKHWDDVMKHFDGRAEMYKKPLAGFESLPEVRARIYKAMRTIDERYQGKTILVVSHGTPVRLIHALAAGHNDDLGFHNPKNAEIKHCDFVALPRNSKGEIDYHRPFIDSLNVVDSQGRPMKRVQDVFDCWFESGAMPFAQMGYKGKPVTLHGEYFNPNLSAWRKGASVVLRFLPFAWANSVRNKIERAAGFPAEFIAEGLDQTRGWFYSLLVLGVALFGRSPYKHVVVNGLVLAEDGKKMSKRLKNYPDPMEMVEKYGMDAVRILLLASPAVRGEDLCFSEKAVDEVSKKILNRLDNMLTFYEMYAGGEGDMGNGEDKSGDNVSEVSAQIPAASALLDSWIMSRLNETIAQTTAALERYELNTAFRPIADLIEDMSLWYVRRSRDRFKSENLADKQAALETTRIVLMRAAQLLAPYAPFMAEYVYGRVVASVAVSAASTANSVHLTSWPVAGEIDGALIKEMHSARTYITSALEARTKAGIKIRQPLASLTLHAPLSRDGFADLIADEVNVKAVSYDPVDLKVGEVRLDTVLTAELRREGALREMMRAIQDARKTAGMVFTDRPTLIVSASLAADPAFIAMKNDLIKETGLAGIRPVTPSDALLYKFEGEEMFGLAK